MQRKLEKFAMITSVPFLLNTAYSSGRMEIDGKKIGADFIACSGHKSWAAGGGNIGILAIKEGWQDKVFKRSANWKSKPLEITWMLLVEVHRLWH